MANKKKGRGKPFTENDPRRGTGGRRKKTVSWKKAEDKLREAIPRLLLMTEEKLKKLLTDNPIGAEMLAAKYIEEHIPQAIERFLGKVPSELTGKDGEPLIPKAPAPILPPMDFSNWSPKQIDKFIAATKAK